jgi:hypothetical protein
MADSSIEYFDSFIIIRDKDCLLYLYTLSHYWLCYYKQQ